MSTESTEAVFAALALANIPAQSWSVEAFTDHQKESAPLSVAGYTHAINLQGVTTLMFAVSRAAALTRISGKFKKGTVNEVDVDGAAQPPPTFHGPVEAGTGAFDAQGVKTQVWLRCETGGHLKEYRFETSVRFPHPLPTA